MPRELHCGVPPGCFLSRLHVVVVVIVYASSALHVREL